jgi:hypothetical protein
MDDASGWTHAAFVKEKSQQFEEFKAFVAAFTRQYGIKIKRLRSDGGNEYSSGVMGDFLKQNGIQWERSALHVHPSRMGELRG